ncbi:hypothetical protein C8R47DRAFT_1312759 [Mycena vitilis]|nr:hypothetical protein C8R47DRAFT_1312745 [Mycena vitilis]KAJ6517200.1 hypothetical protein C8R47DRAFT_1312759 [Mycena vitilis]
MTYSFVLVAPQCHTCGAPLISASPGLLSLRSAPPLPPLAPAVHQLSQHRALADLDLAVCPARYVPLFTAFHGCSSLCTAPSHPTSCIRHFRSLGTTRCLTGPWLDAVRSLCRHLPLSTRAPRCVRRRRSHRSHRSRPCSLASTPLRLPQHAALLQIPLAVCHPPLLPPFKGDLEHSSLCTALPFPPLARAVPLDLQLLPHHLLIDPHFTEHHAPLRPPLGSSVRSPLRGPTLLPLLPARRAARTAFPHVASCTRRSRHGFQQFPIRF